MGVDAEYGGVFRVDKAGLLAFLRQAAGDVLPYARHAETSTCSSLRVVAFRRTSRRTPPLVMSENLNWGYAFASKLVLKGIGATLQKKSIEIFKTVTHICSSFKSVIVSIQCNPPRSAVILAKYFQSGHFSQTNISASIWPLIRDMK